MSDQWPEEVELSDFLMDLANVQLKVRLPAPVVVALADLVGLVPSQNRRQGTTNPGELVAAFIVWAFNNHAGASTALGDYRETQAHEVLLGATGTSGLHPMPVRLDLDL